MSNSTNQLHMKSECNVDDDCKKGSNGQCKYNGDYVKPSKKCYYPCTVDKQCTDLGGQCKNGYCATPDQPVRPWISSPNENTVSSNLAESEDLQEKLLEDIQNLQNLEQYLFGLLNNPNLTPEEKEEILKKIEGLTKMRINLYKNLKQINTLSTSSPVTNSALTDQKTAVDIMEEELNKLKKTAQENNQDRLNKIRMIEINNYYSSRYQDHADVLKTGIFFLLAFVILYFVNSKGLLPEIVFSVLKYILVVATVYFLGSKLLNMWLRDPMNYDEYNWYFNPKTAPAPLGTSNNFFSAESLLGDLGFNVCSK